jgi:hypothetical protein
MFYCFLKPKHRNEFVCNKGLAYESSTVMSMMFWRCTHWVSRNAGVCRCKRVSGEHVNVVMKQGKVYKTTEMVQRLSQSQS